MNYKHAANLLFTSLIDSDGSCTDARNASDYQVLKAPKLPLI